jgi:hypothetical protein
LSKGIRLDGRLCRVVGRANAGVDWAAEKHDVFVADAAGEKLLAATFARDEQGLRSLCRQPGSPFFKHRKQRAADQTVERSLAGVILAGLRQERVE